MTIHHVSVGARDVARTAGFYDAVLAALGLRRVMDYLPHAVGYGRAAPVFWVGQPHDHLPASSGNGVHIAFAAPSRAAVDAFYAAALANGGRDGGAPGLRPDYTPDYYGAFCFDPEGNKIEAVIVGDATARPARAKTAKTAARKTAKAKTAKSKTAKSKTATRKAGGAAKTPPRRPAKKAAKKAAKTSARR